MRNRLLVLALVVACHTYAQSSDPQTLFQLGVTRQTAGDLRGALDAYSAALKAGFPVVGRVQYRIAAVETRLGEKEKAFEALQAAVSAGFAQPDVLYQDNDFLPLRSDHRFDDIAAAARRNQHPCASAPEFRQFDYWLGEWDVEIGGQKSARSSVQLILDDCVIFENYGTLNGSYAGKSFSMWDAAAKKWEQRYVDTSGALHQWSGNLDHDTMTFYWERMQGGVKTLGRMSYLREDPDRVRQVLEDSTDGGKSWTKTYDGLYIRRK